MSNFFYLILYLTKSLNHILVRRWHDKGDYNNESNNDEFELPVFDLSTLNKATDNFLIGNKLGEGGFGPVFKVNILQLSHLSSRSNTDWGMKLNIFFTLFKNFLLLIHLNPKKAINLMKSIVFREC